VKYNNGVIHELKEVIKEIKKMALRMLEEIKNLPTKIKLAIKSWYSRLRGK